MMRNPIFESSLKRRMRSYRSPLLITLYVLFLLVVAGGALGTLQADTVSLGNLRSGLETYVYLAIMQFMLIILVAPALTSGAISGERERQTLDLLLCTRVGSMRIVLGKLLSSTCFLALMIITSLPIMAVTMFFGGISILDMLYMELFLFVCALGCCSIGIFCSSLFKRTVTATVVSYLMVFAIGIVTLGIPFIFQAKLMQSALDTINEFYSTASAAAIQNATSDMGYVLSVVRYTPKLFFVNPAIGLFSMLISQTGLLQRTFEQVLGYRGYNLFTIINNIGSVAGINMAFMAVLSVLLTCVSAIFVKPTGKRIRKRK